MIKQQINAVLFYRATCILGYGEPVTFQVNHGLQGNNSGSTAIICGFVMLPSPATALFPRKRKAVVIKTRTRGVHARQWDNRNLSARQYAVAFTVALLHTGSSCLHAKWYFSPYSSTRLTGGLIISLETTFLDTSRPSLFNLDNVFYYSSSPFSSITLTTPQSRSGLFTLPS